MYPESISDYRKLHSVEQRLSFWSKIGDFLSGPIFILGVAVVWGIYLLAGK